MNSDLCRELMHHLDDGSLRLDHAPDDVQGWFETLGLQLDLLRFMQSYWPQRGGHVRHLYLRPSREIRDDSDTARLLPHKLLNIGSAPNGDLLVLDFSTEACIPGFVSHDELWGEDDANPRQVLQPIARTLESLLFRLAEGRYVPTDYYAAIAFNRFLADERAHA